jgi:hypothetical protein
MSKLLNQNLVEVLAVPGWQRTETSAAFCGSSQVSYAPNGGGRDPTGHLSEFVVVNE